MHFDLQPPRKKRTVEKQVKEKFSIIDQQYHQVRKEDEEMRTDFVIDPFLHEERKNYW